MPNGQRYILGQGLHVNGIVFKNRLGKEEQRISQGLTRDKPNTTIASEKWRASGAIILIGRCGVLYFAYPYIGITIRIGTAGLYRKQHDTTNEEKAKGFHAGKIIKTDINVGLTFSFFSSLYNINLNLVCLP
ncbi:hypothetical protein GCM10028827_38900 [Mucilaginibacter myungsuensis]